MSDDSNVEKGYRIRGRVQGVGFRWWARSQARRLGLSGSVRNRADGSVVVHARGTARAIAQFERLLKEGPSSSEVVELESLTPERMSAEGFEILH
jgi:acylphosphatase